MAAGRLEVMREMSAEVEINLAAVKQFTQQVKSFGFDTEEDPIFQWRLPTIDDKSPSHSSDLFLINNSDCRGQLNLTYANSTFKLSLSLTDMEKGEAVKNVQPFQFFLYKCTLYCRDFNGKFNENCYFSMNAFHENADKNELNFQFIDRYAEAMTVELYEEPLAMIRYRSPFKNMVMGKIEKFKEMMAKIDYHGFLFLSPRFDFGSPDQLMVVKMWHATVSYVSCLYATLRILSQGGPRGAPFSFAVTFTVFSQTAEVRDSIHKVFFLRDENKSEYPILLAFAHNLDPYLENDTMYFKVVIEPHLSTKVVESVD